MVWIANLNIVLMVVWVWVWVWVEVLIGVFPWGIRSAGGLYGDFVMLGWSQNFRYDFWSLA